MEMDDFPPDDLGPHFGDPLWDRKYENPNPYAPKPESEDPEASPGEIPDDDESHIWAPDEIQQQLRFMVLIKNTGDTPMKFTTGIR